MALFDKLFYSNSMLAVFNDESRIQRMLDFEAALAHAEAAQGVIPTYAAQIIASQCKVELLHMEALRDDAMQSGNLAIPLVRQLTKLVQEVDPDAARYVHWGTTSQDAIDTGTVLQIRDALNVVDKLSYELCNELASLAEKHIATVMPGRTWLQHAVPITFGSKAAGWLDAMLRHRQRLLELRPRILTLQFGGAAGTLASLGPDAGAVSTKLAANLNLAEADIPWHTSRDRFAEAASILGLVTTTLGKIARDIALLMQTEVAEAAEPSVDGQGGSSTMPQKRNPVGCASVLAAAIRVPGLVATMLASAVQEHERGLGNWHAEWEVLPGIFNLCAGALERTRDIVAHLEVDATRMSANLELTHGLIYAEAVSMALSEHFSKPEAHRRVQLLCQKATKQHRHLRGLLLEDAEIQQLNPPLQLEKLFNPKQYLGTSSQSIRRVLDRAYASGIEKPPSWIEWPGVRIHYRLDGDSTKPVLVLSNSLGANLSMWDAQIAAFSECFHVLRYDTRGHGQSSISPGPYTLDILGRDVLEMLDALGIQEFDFCGLSMGGIIGQWLGIHAADRVRKLVLCNTASKIGVAEVWNARIDEVLNSGVEAVSEAILQRWFTPAYRDAHPRIAASTKAMLNATDRAGYAANCAAVRDADLRDLVHRIQTPTLVVAGIYDPVTTPEDGRQLARKIEGAQYVELNAAHLSNVEASEDFTASTLKFLTS